MNFENLKIKKVISHFIYQYADHTETSSPPFISKNVITLNDFAKKTLINRLLRVLGRDSKSIKMQISDTSIESCFEYINKALLNNRKDFILQSQNIANRLANIQKKDGRLPGGLLIIIYATVTKSDLDCIIVIKAEEQSAFQKKMVKNKNSLSLNLLNDLFLTPQSKLYKVGVFIKKNMTNDFTKLEEIAQNFTAILYDSNFTKDLKSAAKYFYHSFLGLSIPEDGKVLTRNLYIQTSDFINKMDISQEKKVDLQNALYIELKTNTSSTISTTTFAKNYLDDDTQNKYIDAMKEANLPDIEILKDTSLIKDMLKLRCYYFSNGVKITSPSENDSVEFISTDEEIPKIDREKSTLICIKGVLSKQ